jgi:hypothetical protein
MDDFLNAALLFHKQLISRQIVFTRNDSALIITPWNFAGAADILIRRNINEDLQQHRRLVDNEELSVISILDNYGTISTTARLIEFMALMTRITKVRIQNYVVRSAFLFAGRA